MPQIILTEDLNERKGLVKGAMREWPRSTITQISKSMKRNDWFEMSADIHRRQDALSVRRKKTAKKKEEG